MEGCSDGGVIHGEEEEDAAGFLSDDVAAGGVAGHGLAGEEAERMGEIGCGHTDMLPKA